MNWRDKAQQRVKDKQSGSSIKIDEGTNCLRVMPDRKDISADGKVTAVVHPPYREFRIHRSVGPDEAMVGCGKDIEGKGKCWLCDAKIPELEATGVSQKRLMAQKIGAAEQFVVNASKVDPDTQKFTPPKPWWVSTGSGIPGRQSQSLATRVYSKLASSKRDFVDPNKGYNLNVERSGTGLKTRYTGVESDESPTRVPASVLMAVKDLDSVIPAYSEEDQKSAYFGRPRRDEEEDRPRRGARRAEPEEEEESKDPADDEVPEDEEVSETEEEPVAEDAEEVEEEEQPPADDEYEEAPPEDEEVEEEPPAEEDVEEEVPTEEEEYEEEPEPEPPPRRTAPAKKPAPAAVKKPIPPAAKKPAPRPAAKPAPKPAAKKR